MLISVMPWQVFSNHCDMAFATFGHTFTIAWHVSIILHIFSILRTRQKVNTAFAPFSLNNLLNECGRVL